jgi:hypothetical protein
MPAIVINSVEITSLSFIQTTQTAPLPTSGVISDLDLLFMPVLPVIFSSFARSGTTALKESWE